MYTGSFPLRSHHPPSAVQHPASSIQHPASNVHPAIHQTRPSSVRYTAATLLLIVSSFPSQKKTAYYQDQTIQAGMQFSSRIETLVVSARAMPPLRELVYDAMGAALQELQELQEDRRCLPVMPMFPQVIAFHCPTASV